MRTIWRWSALMPRYLVSRRRRTHDIASASSRAEHIRRSSPLQFWSRFRCARMGEPALIGTQPQVREVCWCSTGARRRETSHEVAPRCMVCGCPHARRFRGGGSMRASRAHFLHAFARFGPTTCAGQVGWKVQKARSDVVRRQGLEPRTRRLRVCPVAVRQGSTRFGNPIRGRHYGRLRFAEHCCSSPGWLPVRLPRATNSRTATTTSCVVRGEVPIPAWGRMARRPGDRGEDESRRSRRDLRTLRPRAASLPC
jgi:hypothetical protein